MSRIISTQKTTSSRHRLAIASALAFGVAFSALSTAQAQGQFAAPQQAQPPQAVSTMPQEYQQQILATYGDCIKRNPILWNATYDDLVRACTPAPVAQPAYVPPPVQQSAYAPAPRWTNPGYGYNGGYNGYSSGRGTSPIGINVITTGGGHVNTPGPVPTPNPKPGNCGINPHAPPCNLPRPLPTTQTQIPAGQNCNIARRMCSPLEKLQQQRQQHLQALAVLQRRNAQFGQKPQQPFNPLLNNQNRPLTGQNPMVNHPTSLAHLHRPNLQHPLTAQRPMHQMTRPPFLQHRPMTMQRPVRTFSRPATFNRPVMSRPANGPIRTANFGGKRRR